MYTCSLTFVIYLSFGLLFAQEFGFKVNLEVENTLNFSIWPILWSFLKFLFLLN